MPKTGWMAEAMAKVAAHNIAAAITGGEPREMPFGDIRPLCIMDAGTQGMIIGLDRVFKPRKFEVMLPGPWAHWAKLGFRALLHDQDEARARAVAVNGRRGRRASAYLRGSRRDDPMSRSAQCWQAPSNPTTGSWPSMKARTAV